MQTPLPNSPQPMPEDSSVYLQDNPALTEGIARAAVMAAQDIESIPSEPTETDLSFEGQGAEVIEFKPQVLDVNSEVPEVDLGRRPLTVRQSVNARAVKSIQGPTFELLDMRAAYYDTQRRAQDIARHRDAA